MAYWQPLSGVQDPIPIRRFDGVYKPDDEGFNLSDGLFTELSNYAPDEYPAIKTRPGFAVLNGFTGVSVLGMGAWKDSELHVVFGDGTWRRLNSDGSWSTLASGLNTTAEWTFCNFKGNLSTINLIGTNGVDPVKRYDGSSVQNLANAPAGANYMTTQSNRLYCAVGNLLKYSALNEADDWTTVDDAGEIELNTRDGETINGLNAGNGHVTAFKPSSLHELYGKGPKSYQLDQIAADIGSTGNKAVAVYDETLPFISRDGIYRYAGGIRPQRDYSTPVHNFVKRMNPSHFAKCAAGNDGRYLYFAIPFGTATQNNRILQYDPIHQSWYTWEGISAKFMIRVRDKFYIGDSEGRVFRVEGSKDFSVLPITATAITKPFTAQSIARKSHWFKLWVVASIEAGSTLQVFVSGQAEGESWTLATTLTPETGVQYKEILIPTNSIAAANAVRLKLVAAGVVTIHEITRQLRELPMRR